MAVVAGVVVAVAAMAPVVVQESIAACELPPRPAHLRRILVSMLIRKMPKAETWGTTRAPLQGDLTRYALDAEAVGALLAEQVNKLRLPETALRTRPLTAQGEPKAE